MVTQRRPIKNAGFKTVINHSIYYKKKNLFSHLVYVPIKLSINTF